MRSRGPLCRRALPALLALSLVSCSSGESAGSGPAGSPGATTAAASSPTSGATTDAPSTIAASTTAPAPPAPPPRDPRCEPGPDRTVSELGDVTAAAVVVPDFEAPAEVVAGETIPATRLPGFTIPAIAVDAGCIIEHAAPGGCLGAIEITGVSIPDVSIPGLRIEPVVIDGVEFAPAVVRPALFVPGASSPDVRREQTCEVIVGPETGDVPALYREALARPRALRAEGLRSVATRDAVCIDGECGGPVSVDQVVVPALILSEVVVPTLVSTVSAVPDASDISVVETPGQTSYTASSDVVFDLDQAVLRADALPSLMAIAERIGTAPDASAVLVEGHTDSAGESAYNQQLSLARAQAVTDWLVGEGGVAPERIATTGFGEDVPVAPNERADGTADPEGRARNRRVVISVLEQK